MLLFSVNFNIYFLIIARKFSSVLKNEELRLFGIIVLVSIMLITLNTVQMFGNVGGALHHSSFAVASIISTSGFVTVDFNTWPDFSKTILVLLMFIGACAGSTGGGIKVSRILIILKALKREFSSMIHPRSVKTIKVTGKRISDETIRRSNLYLVCYIALFFISLLVISFDNFGFETNFTSVAATLNNVGPGLGAVGPSGNFAAFSPLSKIVFTIDMICGRLELFPLLILFMPQAWKKY